MAFAWNVNAVSIVIIVLLDSVDLTINGMQYLSPEETETMTKLFNGTILNFYSKIFGCKKGQYMTIYSNYITGNKLTENGIYVRFINPDKQITLFKDKVWVGSY